ncbi:hypothetical protein QJS66_03840 [Kocuria rhizophila]|nr:hypothetical protein QJS66_03840 [Kocuria rhizophila]
METFGTETVIPCASTSYYRRLPTCVRSRSSRTWTSKAAHLRQDRGPRALSVLHRTPLHVERTDRVQELRLRRGAVTPGGTPGAGSRSGNSSWPGAGHPGCSGDPGTRAHSRAGATSDRITPPVSSSRSRAFPRAGAPRRALGRSPPARERRGPAHGRRRAPRAWPPRTPSPGCRRRPTFPTWTWCSTTA